VSRETRTNRVSGKIIVPLLATFLLTTVFHTEAQQAGKVHRVGFLTGGSPGPEGFGSASVRRELRGLGYVEGKNIAYEYRYAEGKPERSPALADELVRLRVDVIVAGGGSDTQAAKNATRTIPIVFLEVRG
jgi:putative tryptophan/tyrosine transport system substrate-binding protein